MAWSIEAIVVLLLAELGQFGYMHIAMEGMIGIQAISILWTIVVSFQNWIGMPSSPIQVSMIGGISASLGVAFLSLEPFVSLAIGGIERRSCWFEWLMCCGSPICLYIIWLVRSILDVRVEFLSCRTCCSMRSSSCRSVPLCWGWIRLLTVRSCSCPVVHFGNFAWRWRSTLSHGYFLPWWRGCIRRILESLCFLVLWNPWWGWGYFAVEVGIGGFVHVSFWPFLEALRIDGFASDVVQFGTLKIVACAHLQKSVDLVTHFDNLQ